MRLRIVRNRERDPIQDRAARLWRRLTGLASRPILILLVLAGMGCSERLLDPLPVLEESAIPITVVRADPTEAEQGQTLEVTIFGTGFAPDATATWELNGQPEPRITVQKLTYVSDTQLIATISIDRTASIADYDISVRKRKKGISTEFEKGLGEDLFKVFPYTPNPLGWLANSLWYGADENSIARAINNGGMIAGGSNGPAVYWTEAGGIVEFGAYPAYANGINEQGWVVGVSGERDDQYWVDAFLLESGVVTILQPLEAPHPSVATAINGAGTIVGYGSKDWWRDPTWPIVWKRDAVGKYGAPMQLPLPNGEQWKVDDHQEGSAASAINKHGDIVGTLSYGWMNKTTKAVLWKAGANGAYGEPIVLGGINARAYGINDAGWIVGTEGGTYGLQAKPSRPVLWHPSDYGRPIPIGQQEGSDFAGVAVAINNNGQVAGHYMQGFLWMLDEAGDTTEEIPLVAPSGYSYSRPAAINDHGWVVGLSGGFQPARYQATLWRP